MKFVVFWVVVGVVIVGALITIFTLVAQQQSHFENLCHEQGGHVVRVSRSEICVGSDGRYLGQE